MTTPVDRRTNYLPSSGFVWGVGFYIGYFLAVAAQDLAGLDYGSTIPLSYRLPAMALCVVGAIVLAWIVLAWCERKFNSSSSAKAPTMRRLAAIVLVVLVLAAPIVQYHVSLGAYLRLGPNLSLNPDASPAALTRRPLGAG